MQTAFLIAWIAGSTGAILTQSGVIARMNRRMDNLQSALRIHNSLLDLQRDRLNNHMSERDAHE